MNHSFDIINGFGRFGDNTKTSLLMSVTMTVIGMITARWLMVGRVCVHGPASIHESLVAANQ